MPSARFRWLATAAAVAAWGLIVVGGVVRVTESGLGCPHWPLCTSRALPLDQTASVIEYSHRVLVAVVSVLAVAVATGAWRRYRSRRDITWPALLAVVLVPFQALLGAVAVWLELPGWVVAFHFVVGFVFFGALTVCAAATWRRSESRASAAFVRLADVTVVAAFALVTLGASVVATDADYACGAQWPACNGGFATGGGHAELQVAHRLLAYTVLALTAALFVLALRGKGPRLAGTLPLIAALGQAAFGVSIVLVGTEGRTHDVLSGLHVGGAATVWAAVLVLATVARPTERVVAERAIVTPASFQLGS